jgi:3-isopropylmalate/(R)-2-methylmalate dehydratase small subunit
MEPVTTVSGRAYPFGRKNVDTDVIIPAHYLKTISRIGLGKGAFETVRAEPGNVFDDPEYAGAPIIIAGDNFGCGSSREHAAWALNDMGVQAVIAPSFSDIFSSNAFKNGIVAVVLPQEAVDRLLEVAKTQPITVDPFRRNCLISGLDEIGLTLSNAERIGDYEAAMAKERPWLGEKRAA